MANSIITIPVGQTGDQVAKALGSGFNTQAEAEGAGFVFQTAPTASASNESTTTKPKTALEYAKDLANSLGLTTPQADALRRQEIADQLAAARRARAAQAESLFGQKIASAEKISAGEAIGVKNIGGQSAGFNMSTANQALLNNVYKKLDDTKGQIAKEKQAYIDEGNWQAVERADKQIQDLEDKRQAILLKQADWAINYDTQQAGREMDVAQLRLSVPEGKTIDIGGTKYTGLKTVSPNTQLIKNEATGDVSVINSDTGELINTIKGVAGQTYDIKEIGNKIYKIDAAGNMIDTGVRTPSSGGGGGGGEVTTPTGGFSQEDIDLANNIFDTVVVDGQIDYGAMNDATQNLSKERKANITSLIIKGLGAGKTPAETSTGAQTSNINNLGTGPWSTVDIRTRLNQLKSIIPSANNKGYRDLLRSSGYNDEAINMVVPKSIVENIADVTDYLFSKA